jgi:hypothetical protein
MCEKEIGALLQTNQRLVSIAELKFPITPLSGDETQFYCAGCSK